MKQHKGVDHLITPNTYSCWSYLRTQTTSVSNIKCANIKCAKTVKSLVGMRQL